MDSSRLTDDDKRNIATALLSYASAGDEIVRRCRSANPATGSRMQRWHDTFDPDSGADYPLRAFLAANASVLSGADHLRALNTLVSSWSTPTTSSATLARGAVEAYARASRLAASPTVEDLVWRHICALHEEYRYAVIHGEMLTNLSGETIDPAILRAENLAELTRLQLPAPARPENSAMVKDLLDRASAGTSGGHVYSGLSSVAHSQPTGVGAFISATAEGEILGLKLDRNTLVNLIYVVTAAARQTLEDITDLFGRDEHQVALLNSATDLVSASRKQLLEAR